MSKSLANTPSTGEYEVLRALHLAHGHDGNYISPARLMRFFPPKTDADEVADVLEGESATYVTASNGKYTLTAAGVKRSRQNRPRRSRFTIG